MVTVADTAFSIALVRAEEAERPASEQLFEDPYASVFLAAVGDAAEATQRYVELPFFREGVRLRTRFIDDFVREGLAAGLAQVVLLGAGFDTRGLRMPEIAARGAAVFEVDFAAQLEKKRALLAAAGVLMPPWIAHVACDFAQPDFEAALTSGLEEQGFRRGAGAIFVREGVIAYIDDAAVHRTLGFIARAGGPGSRVAFDFAVGRFEPVTIGERARRAGLSSCDQVGYDALWRKHLAGEPHPVASICLMGTAVV